MFKSDDLTKSFFAVSILKLIFSISTVYCIKYNYMNFSFPIILITSGQFLFLFFGASIVVKFGKYAGPKQFSIKEIATSSVLLCFSVLFNNFSIDYNSIQVAQQFTFIQLPLMLIILTLYNKQTFSYKIKSLSILICIPIIWSTKHASDLNFVGIVFACLTVLFESIHYWWIAKRYNSNESLIQMLFYQAAVSFLFLISMSFTFEDNFDEFGLYSPERPFSEWVFIVLTCVVSSFYYLLVYYSIESGHNSILINNGTSVLTMIFAGIIGTFEFYDCFGTEQIISTVIVTIGVLIYSLIYTIEERNFKKELSKPIAIEN